MIDAIVLFLFGIVLLMSKPKLMDGSRIIISHLQRRLRNSGQIESYLFVKIVDQGFKESLLRLLGIGGVYVGVTH